MEGGPWLAWHRFATIAAVTLATSSWLPQDFEHPYRVQLSGGLHLRPIRATDVDIDLPAVRGSQERLWAKYGRAWGWPPASMTDVQDYVDLDRHEQEIQRHLSFNYALLNRDETALLGCVYLDPVPDEGDERIVEVSWWVVDELVGTSAEAELAATVPAWLHARWPFDSVRYPFGDGPGEGRTAAVPDGAFSEERRNLPAMDTDAAQAMWADYLSAHPEAAITGTEQPAEAFGDSVELADELIGLVLRGVKTATASLVADFVAEEEPLPRIGGHWIACDGSGTPRAVLRTVSLAIGPADSVDETFAWDEGELDRSREAWLSGHLDYWQRTTRARGETWTPEHEVVFERIRVVWPPEAAKRAAAFRDSVAARPVPGVS